MDQAERLRNIIKKQNQQRSVARVITVTSGKGGVGKSSVSVNLAIQLRRQGKRVIILDADFGLANVEVMLGIRPAYNLADLMFKGKSLADIITRGPEDIGFISGGSGIQELTNLTRDQIVYLTQKLVELDNLADVIIIDTGAGISDAVLEFVTASSEVLLIATPEPTSITDAYALLKTLNKKADFMMGNTVIKMIANRVGNFDEGRELFAKLSVVVEKFLNIKMLYLGAIPQDSNVSKAVMQQKPISIVYPNSQAATALGELAVMLNNDIINNQTDKKGIAQFFSDIMKMKRNK
jgi:ATPases involved in chromosome partitioning